MEIKYIILNVTCDKKYLIRLTPSQRKLLHLLDIEISNKNQNIKCSVECGSGIFSFRFTSGLFEVYYLASSTDELFPKIDKFMDSFRNLDPEPYVYKKTKSSLTDSIDKNLYKNHEQEEEPFDYVSAERKEKDKVKSKIASYIFGLCGC